jgi:hypothetical protein
MIAKSEVARLSLNSYSNSSNLRESTFQNLTSSINFYLTQKVRPRQREPMRGRKVPFLTLAPTSQSLLSTWRNATNCATCAIPNLSPKSPPRWSRPASSMPRSIWRSRWAAATPCRTYFETSCSTRST